MLKFLDCGFESRCFVECERVLAAEHLILIGLKDLSGETAEIIALCVQTSHLFGDPHQIFLRIKSLSSEPEVEEGRYVFMRSRPLRNMQALVRDVAP